MDKVGELNEYGWETGVMDGPILRFMRETDARRYAAHRKEVFEWLCSWVNEAFRQDPCEELDVRYLESLWGADHQENA